MSTLYVDLSHHDWDRVKGEFDWAAIRRATSPVLCLRATYGDPAGYNPTTRHFADMALGARAAGFDTIGGYHNLIAGDQASINRQVDYLRREMDRAGAVWAMLDVERYPELVNNGLFPRFSDAQQFCDRWRVVDSRPLLVYLPKWIWDGHMGRPDLRTLRCPLVASNYGSNPNGTPSGVYTARGGDTGPGWSAYGGVTPTIWQFGSNVDCPGASGATDVNAYRGSLAELRTLLNATTPEEEVTEEELIAAVVKGVHRSLGLAATRSDATGRQIGDSIAALLSPVYAGQRTLGEAIAREASSPDEVRTLLAALPQPQVDVDAFAAALAPKLVTSLPADSPITDEQLARVLRSVLGSLDATQS